MSKLINKFIPKYININKYVSSVADGSTNLSNGFYITIDQATYERTILTNVPSYIEVGFADTNTDYQLTYLV